MSTSDLRTQKMALNNAVNLQKLYGIDNVKIEVVSYGPGLGLVTTKSSQADRVTSLAMQEITFSACMNTMKKIEKKTGKAPYCWTAFSPLKQLLHGLWSYRKKAMHTSDLDPRISSEWLAALRFTSIQRAEWTGSR